jgi:hypothetical protein
MNWLPLPHIHRYKIMTFWSTACCGICCRSYLAKWHGIAQRRL